MSRYRLAHEVARIALAVLCVVAITYQLARLQGHPAFRGAGNYFSFFTIQSNIIGAAMFVLTALVRPGERSLGFEALRGAATFYVAITGVVFAALLSGLQEQLDTHNEFVNSTVHYVIPAAAVVDWFLDPPRQRLGLKVATLWLVYPLLWFASHARPGQCRSLVPVSVRGPVGARPRASAATASFSRSRSPREHSRSRGLRVGEHRERFDRRCE